MLLGCDDEMAALSGLLDRAANRHSGALAVRGDAGIGKSSLAAPSTRPDRRSSGWSRTPSRCPRGRR